MTTQGNTHRPTQPLREEHKELLPHIEQLRSAADAAGHAPAEALRAQAAEAHAFLTGHLLPHATAEEIALYPVVGRLLGSSEATATMSRDHVEIVRLTKDLHDVIDRLSGAEPAEADILALRRVLYGLYALVHVHFAKEEEIYLPLLDTGLSAGDVAAMYAEMERAAGEAKAAVR